MKKNYHIENLKMLPYAIVLVLVMLLISALFSGCMSTAQLATQSGITASELANIPNGAKEVIIKANNRDSLYNSIVDVLIERGHRITKEDKERYYLLTEGKDVGNDTMQRMTISVKESAEAIIKAEWMPGQLAMATATSVSGISVTPSWTIADMSGGRSSIAFFECINIAKHIKRATYRAK